MGPREGRAGASRWPWPRMFALVGLLGLIVMDAVHGDGEMRELCIGRADSLAWPGAGLSLDWTGRGAFGHAPGVDGWLALRAGPSDWSRPRQEPAAVSPSVGGGECMPASAAEKDPRRGLDGNLSVGEEACIALARLLGVRLGETGHPGPCKIASVNVTSLRRVVPAILKLDWDVLCVQESNIDVRSDEYKGLMGELRDHNVALYRVGLEEGKCKVAFLVKKSSFRLEGPAPVVSKPTLRPG